MKVGDAVPHFRLKAGTGETVESQALLGQRWVIYFYPKDNTSGCTIEATEFGRALPDFKRSGVRVFGCSVGGVKAKTEFAVACGAPELPLLSDPDHKVADSFGVWRERTKMGRTYMQTARVTFLIGPEGKVEKIWDQVVPQGHAADVLEELSRVGARSA